MKVIDLEAHFYTKDYTDYLRSRRDPPREVVMRLIYSGLFDRFPGLKIVLGHMGEGIPYWLYRIDFYRLKPWVDQTLKPQCRQKPSYYINRNFLFTSSGMQFLPAFFYYTQEIDYDSTKTF